MQGAPLSTSHQPAESVDSRSFGRRGNLTVASEVNNKTISDEWCSGGVKQSKSGVAVSEKIVQLGSFGALAFNGVDALDERVDQD